VPDPIVLLFPDRNRAHPDGPIVCDDPTVSSTLSSGD
jgi:hypothetical protein